MTVLSRSLRSVSPWSMKSCDEMASIGTADCVTVRGPGPAPDGDQSFQGDGGLVQLHVQVCVAAVGDRDLADLHRVAEQHDLHRVGPGRDVGDLVVAVQVRDAAQAQLRQGDLRACEPRAGSGIPYCAFETSLARRRQRSHAEEHQHGKRVTNIRGIPYFAEHSRDHSAGWKRHSISQLSSSDHHIIITIR